MSPQAAAVAAPVLTILLLWLPGVLPLLAAGIRPATAAAVAPAVTFGLVAAATLLLPRAFGWSVPLLLGTSVVVAVLLAGWRMWRARAARAGSAPGPAEPPSAGEGAFTKGSLLVLVVGAVATAVVVYVYVHVSRELTVVPQDFDHVFQANAIRYIAESGDPSPTGLRAINDYTSTSAYYYPSAWHALGALVVPLVGGNVLAVFHSLVIAMLVALPLGIGVLTRSFGAGHLGTSVAVAVAATFANLPWEMLWRGLLPFAMSIVLVVPVILLAREGARRRTVPGAVVLALAVFGPVSVHTSAAMTLVVVGGPALVAVLIASRGERLRVTAWLGSAAAIVGIALVPMVGALSEVLGNAEVRWPSELRIREGALHALTFTGVYRDVEWLNLGWFVVAGMIVAVASRSLWRSAFVVSTLVAMGLFVLTAAVDKPWAETLTQFWWDDPLRTAAISTLVAPAFVGLLVDAGWRWLRGRARGGRAGAAPIASVATALVVGAIAWAAWLSLSHGERYVAFKFTDGPTVTDGEREAYEFLAEVDPDGRVMNDPGDGSAWMYALDGVRPVFGHFSIPGNAPEAELLYGAFDIFTEREDVAEVVRKYDIEYAVVGSGMVFPSIDEAPGITELDEMPDVFREIFRNEDAVIYEVIVQP